MSDERDIIIVPENAQDREKEIWHWLIAHGYTTKRGWARLASKWFVATYGGDENHANLALWKPLIMHGVCRGFGKTAARAHRRWLDQIVNDDPMVRLVEVEEAIIEMLRTYGPLDGARSRHAIEHVLARLRHADHRPRRDGAKAAAAIEAAEREVRGDVKEQRLPASRSQPGAAQEGADE